MDGDLLESYLISRYFTLIFTTMKIVTVSLLNNVPLNTWWKSGSFFVNNTLWKNNDLLFLYFHKEWEQKWEIPNRIAFNAKYINKKFRFKFLPDFLQKMNYEFLFNKWELKNIKADVILLEFPYLYHIAKIISKQNNNCPIYLLEHNIEYQYYKREWSKLWWFIKIYERYVLKHVSKIITVSKHDYEYIKQSKLNKSVYLIKHWVADEIYNPNWESHCFNNAKFNILFYWSLKSEFNKKALYYLYNEISPRLWDEYQINVCWRNVDNIPDKNNLKFHWFVEKIEDYIRWCDAVIAPITETVWVNMRILESLYCWKIVLTNSACLKWLDEDLKDAVFMCDSIEDYLKILNKLLSDKKYRLECEKKIKNTINKYIEDWEKILNTIFVD